MQLKQLKPYKSFLFSAIKPITSMDTILSDIQAEIKDRVEVIDRLDCKRGDLDIGFIVYKDEICPSWCIDEGIKDIEHNLVVVVKKKNYLAIYSSDAAIRNKIRKIVSDDTLEPDKSFNYLTLIPQGLMNAAFVKGQAQTLWLSGMHKRTVSKVDNKIITGMDLQYALDPLGDQSYCFTAARCKCSKDENPVGVSPRKSSLWIGISKDWTDFIKKTESLLDILKESKKAKDNPLPVLATSINSKDDIANIGKCYDVAFIPPELLAETDIDEEQKKLAEKWSYAAFEVKSGASGLDFEAVLSHPDQEKEIGVFTFTFEEHSNLPRVNWDVEGEKIGEDSELFNEALDVLKKQKAWIKIWYDSSHVIAECEIFLPRFRDLPFYNYEGLDLTGYEIKKEKPPYPLEEEIGKHKSLFCYTQHNIKKGFLACDDGAMEIADFIHFDDTDRNNPILKLIHVKASKSVAVNREVSVSDYEIVVGQAVKNIRYLSSNNIKDGLVSGLKKKINGATWKNGRKLSTGRKDMIEAIEKYGNNMKCSVIVFQPRARLSKINKTRDTRRGQAYKRLQQLDTLLLGARQACQSAGAEFQVWIDK